MSAQDDRGSAVTAQGAPATEAGAAAADLRPLGPGDPGALDAARVGGKAMNLARLSAGGFDVPPWRALPTDAFRRALDPLRAEVEAALAGRDLGKPAEAEAASAAVRALVLGAPAPWLGELVAAALAGLPPAGGAAPTPDAGEYLAVRSSAVGEDAAATSFAGQLDTFLFVRGAAAVEDAVRRCWASGFSARAIAYRHEHGLDPLDVAVGVVVQRMIEGEVSGVLFTACPTSGRRDVVVASATWGLGEGLVSGALAADGFTVARAGGAVLERDVQPKAERVVWDRAAGAGTTTEAVPEDRREVACLDDPALAALARLGAAIEAHYGGVHQDVEWTRAGGRVYVLQARPITTLPPPPASGPETVWDNSNIIESYSGVTTPLTFSFIRGAYAQAYQQSCELSGIPREEIKENDRVYRSMLGLLQGNVFYNILSWYRLLSLFPGFEKNQEHMEQMMGIREATRIAAARPRRTLGQRLHMAWCMIRNFWTVDALVARFERNFKENWARWSVVDFDRLSLHELSEAYHELVRVFLRRWQAPLVADFCAMVFAGKLKDLTISYGLDPAGGFQNDLLCGEGGIESTEPTRNLIRMAATVRRDPPLRALLEATPDDRCLDVLAATPAHAAFHGEVKAYLERWGFRCMNELKLEEPTLQDRPAFLFTMIKNYLPQADLDVEAMEARERAKRAAAEAVVKRRLWGPRRWVYGWVLKHARKHVKNRENMRFGRTRTYGVLRRLFNAYGRKLVERGALDGWHDVYYLQLDEVLGYADGTTTCTDVRGLAAVRKAEFERFKAAPEPDDRIVTLGAVHAGNAFRKPRAAATGDPKVLRGTPCCPGKVRAKVRVIKSPKDDLSLRGEILVAARTDPGWVPLYPSASGLLIERGSLLSHSAIVARELGLPTIVNIPDLIARVEDGMTVEMDAGEGVARIVDGDGGEGQGG